MQNLVRVSKAKDLPFKKSTYYKWFHLGIHPEIFIKFGGSLFIDIERQAEILEASRGKRGASRAKRKGLLKSEVPCDRPGLADGENAVQCLGG